MNLSSKQLEESATKSQGKSKNASFSDIAHELRTPLAVIKITVEVALLDTNLSTATKTVYEEILNEVDRMSGLITEILSSKKQ